ncbi:hypothetical protein [Actinomadura fulvescens]|uniref:hypothetical protein n=1 Tax=Actinomadura fulvescens TaxID=46160 RepID=UPI0031D90CBA
MLVKGHTAECPQSEPRRYAWQSDGHLCVGTLAEYATAWEQGHCYGDLELSAELRTWSETYPLQVRPLTTDDNWISYQLAAGNESVNLSIDGRS